MPDGQVLLKSRLGHQWLFGHRGLETKVGIDQSMTDRQYGEHGFYAAAGSEGMSGKRFGRAHSRNFFAEKPADGRSFREVIVLCTRPMEVDIVDVGRPEPAALQGAAHGQPGAPAIR